jgi:hypothetical protein
MCGETAGHSVEAMINATHIRPIRTLIGVAVATLLLIVALSPPAGQAAGKTDTLRIFSKPLSFTYTAADGTVTQGPPAGPPQAGDMFEIDSLDYRGNHRRHSKRPIGSDYLRCEFSGSPEPDCHGYAAIGKSLLRFRGLELIGAIGRWESGKLLSMKEVKGGSDIVLKLRRR